jgi:hypothetical protein
MTMIAPSPGPMSKHFKNLAEIKKEDEIIEIDDDIVEIDELDNVVEIDEIEIKDDSDNDIEIIEIKEEVKEEEVEVKKEEVEVEEVEVKEEEVEEVEVKEEVEEADDLVYYKDAQVEYNFGEMRKDNGIYFVPLKRPLLIQTPVVRLTRSLESDSTSIKISDRFATFVKKHDESILKAAKEQKDHWFKHNIDDDVLDEGFKTFLDSSVLKVKIADDLASFDVDGNFIDNDFCTPADVVCVLKISGIWFGSVEFGSIMTLVQTQLARLPKCSIKIRESKSDINYSREFA